jgi:hypothetical protein
MKDARGNLAFGEPALRAIHTGEEEGFYSRGLWKECTARERLKKCE